MRVYFEKGSIEVTVSQNSNGIYVYSIGNTVIGLYDPNVMKDEKIVIRSKTLKDEIASQIKDTIDGMDKNEIEKESQETKKIYTYMKEIGERGDNIRIVKINLNEQEKNKDNKEKNKNKEKQQEDEERVNLEGKKVATTKDLNIKQEIDINEKANDMEDVAQWLGGKLPKDIQKVGVIESTDMSKMQDENGKNYKNGSTRYSLVAINAKGELEPLEKYIPQLKQRDTAGNNPTEKSVQVRADGNVEKDAVLSEYEIGEKVIQIDNKEMGRVEMYIGKEERGGNETLTKQAIDDNTMPPKGNEVNREINNKYSEYGEDVVNKELEEVEKHGEEKNLTYEDADGDPNTKSHDHFEEMADRIIANDKKSDGKISEVYNREDVMKTLEKLSEENPEMNFEELETKAQEYLEEQAEYEHDLPGNRSRR
mgnify:CR=1 FL=1